MNKEIIDWASRGHVVRFYLGKNGKQWGDDWNDAPYECNAGTVYPEFVEGYVEIAFSLDTIVWFAEDDYSKEQFIKREVPFMIIIKEYDCSMYRFSNYVETKFENCDTYYFGDVFDENSDKYTILKKVDNSAEKKM